MSKTKKVDVDSGDGQVNLDQSSELAGAVEPLPDGAQDGELAGGFMTVRMQREEPAHDGGPTTADVHPGEVSNWISAGWRAVENEG